MSKSTLKARIKHYEEMVAGTTKQGRRETAADTRAFHKPGSNKK